MKFGVIIFPGSNCDRDMIHVLRNVFGQEVKEVWHKENSLNDFTAQDCIILPGGFSYGDYLRTGAIARFSPIMEAVITFASKKGRLFGICNGFQILCESGLLPGALLQNANQKYICKNVWLKTMTHKSFVSNNGDLSKPLKIPIAHGDGRFYANQETLESLKKNDQIVFSYCDELGNITEESNPNGSVANIAGICNLERNVIGMMPHPERASEGSLGNVDGRMLFESMLSYAFAF